QDSASGSVWSEGQNSSAPSACAIAQNPVLGVPGTYRCRCRPLQSQILKFFLLHPLSTRKRRCCIITEKLSKISHLHFSLRIQNHRKIRHLPELCNNALERWSP